MSQTATNGTVLWTVLVCDKERPMPVVTGVYSTLEKAEEEAQKQIGDKKLPTPDHDITEKGFRTGGAYIADVYNYMVDEDTSIEISSHRLDDV